MKMKSALLSAFALLAIIAAPLRAQVSVPAFVDYQGTVFDAATGTPLGSGGLAPDFTPAPANYIMQFKIFGSETDADLIWAETQTVTVSLGAFSVRLGSGAPIAGLVPPPTIQAPLTIADAFDGEDRFLELTVLPTGANQGAPITPRLKFQSTPFAFTAKRAAVADSVTSLEGSSLTGTPDKPVALSGFVTSVNTEFSGGTFGTNEEPASFVGDGTALTSLPEFAAQLDDPQLEQTFAGKLGIGAGATTENDKFEAALNISEGGISLYRDSNDYNRPFTREVQAGEIRGHQTNALGDDQGQLRLSAGSKQNAFGGLPFNSLSAIDINGGGTGDSRMIKFYTGGREKMRLNYSGHLGIGTMTPTEELDVAGDAKVSGSMTVENKQVAVGEEKLRIVRGTVDKNGARKRGGGFTSVRTDDGVYEITFDAAFAFAPPSITATAGGDNDSSSIDNFVTIDDVTRTGFVLTSYDTPDAYVSIREKQDAAFMFIAIGPR